MKKAIAEIVGKILKKHYNLCSNKWYCFGMVTLLLIPATLGEMISVICHNLKDYAYFVKDTFGSNK